MKRSLLLGIAIIGAGIGNAGAADFADTDTSDWTGFYGTLSAGYSGVGLDGSQTDFFTETDKSWSDGAAFGLGLGYNHDMGDFVFGLDGDVSFLTNENQLEMKQTVDADYDWFATARVRAGYDADGTLLYATGGLAALGANFDDGADSHKETFVGWTAGAGIEHMIGDSLSIKAEALYADCGLGGFYAFRQRDRDRQRDGAGARRDQFPLLGRLSINFATISYRLNLGECQRIDLFAQFILQFARQPLHGQAVKSRDFENFRVSRKSADRLFQGAVQHADDFLNGFICHFQTASNQWRAIQV